VALCEDLDVLTRIWPQKSGHVVIETCVSDDKGIRRRVRMSTAQTSTRVSPFMCGVPLKLDPSQPRDWFSFSVDLHDILERAYGTRAVELCRVQIHASCCLWRVFVQEHEETAKEMPAKGSRARGMAAAATPPSEPTVDPTWFPSRRRPSTTTSARAIQSMRRRLQEPTLDATAVDAPSDRRPPRARASDGVRGGAPGDARPVHVVREVDGFTSPMTLSPKAGFAPSSPARPAETRSMRPADALSPGRPKLLPADAHSPRRPKLRPAESETTAVPTSPIRASSESSTEERRRQRVAAPRGRARVGGGRRPVAMTQKRAMLTIVGRPTPSPSESLRTVDATLRATVSTITLDPFVQGIPKPLR
jgi:hypothetical protein